jgi:hypothetical protein
VLLVDHDEAEGAERQEEGRAGADHHPATPAIETRVNAERGRYRRVVMPERFGGRRLPEIPACRRPRAPRRPR